MFDISIEVMKVILFSFLVALAAGAFGYPMVRVDQLVPEWTAHGRVTYPGCNPGSFILKFGESFTEWREGCLITSIIAFLENGTYATRARSYTSSGTSFSLFEIVAERPGDETSFCIRRVDTPCSG